MDIQPTVVARYGVRMRQDIRFLLNGKPQRVSHVSADMTLIASINEKKNLKETNKKYKHKK